MTSRIQTRCRAVAAVVAFFGALGLGGAAPPTRAADGAMADRRFEQAMAVYERGVWPAAYAALGAVADDGHGEAARIVLLMQRHGERLYGQRFETPPKRLQHWRDVAVAAVEAQTGAAGGGVITGARP